MTEKITAFKEGFSEIVKLCFEIDSHILQDSVSWVNNQMEHVQDDEDMDDALSMLTEVLMHVNDLDDEYAEPYMDTIACINEIADDLRNDAAA